MGERSDEERTTIATSASGMTSEKGLAGQGSRGGLVS